VSENGSKRRRISVQHDDRAAGQDTNTARPSRKAATATEERKRGQRIFGGLLGALSQTSSTAAQKRRADIEQRQQAKLKQQNEQQSETKRKLKEDIVLERRKQQKHLETSAVCSIFLNFTKFTKFMGLHVSIRWSSDIGICFK
jgi:pinin/SDK/memA/ protein conserved region